MKVQIATKFGEDNRIEDMLKEILEEQISVSVTTAKKDPETYRILLKPSPKVSTIHTVRKVLGHNGYHTQVIHRGIGSRRARLGRTLIYRAALSNIERYNQSVIIAAKVNKPTPPNNPPELPPPGGKKPK